MLVRLTWRIHQLPAPFAPPPVVVFFYKYKKKKICDVVKIHTYHLSCSTAGSSVEQTHFHQ